MKTKGSKVPGIVFCSTIVIFFEVRTLDQAMWIQSETTRTVKIIWILADDSRQRERERKREGS